MLYLLKSFSCIPKFKQIFSRVSDIPRTWWTTTEWCSKHHDPTKSRISWNLSLHNEIYFSSNTLHPYLELIHIETNNDRINRYLTCTSCHWSRCKQYKYLVNIVTCNDPSHYNTLPLIFTLGCQSPTLMFGQNRSHLALFARWHQHRHRGVKYSLHC